MRFSHPLARSSSVQFVEAIDGKAAPTLQVVTTLSLDPSADNFKLEKVTRLRAAIRDYLREKRTDVHSFVLVNPNKR